MYGLRGLCQLTLEVSGPDHDLHSGIDGGIIQEPMVDLVHLLGTLTDKNGNCLVPGFYDGITPLSQEEADLFEPLAKDFDVEAYAQSRGVAQLKAPFSEGTSATDILKQRWCQPSLTIHGIQTSVYEMSLIPSKVSAQVRPRPSGCLRGLWWWAGFFVCQEKVDRQPPSVTLQSPSVTPQPPSIILYPPAGPCNCRRLPADRHRLPSNPRRLPFECIRGAARGLGGQTSNACLARPVLLAGGGGGGMAVLGRDLRSLKG